MIDRDRLKSEMDRHGLSQAHLALLADVSAASIQQILNGKVKHPRSIRNLAAVLGVSVEWLEGLSEDKGLKDEPTPPLDSQQLGIPYFEDIRSIDPLTDFSSQTDRVFFIGVDWLMENIAPGYSAEIAMTRVNMNYMAPTIMPNDDVIVIKLSEFDGDNGSIWIIKYDESLLICRLRRSSEKILCLFSDNPVTPTMDVSESDLRVVGKVVWQGRSLSP